MNQALVILHLNNGAQYICTQQEAGRWADNKFLARTIVRAEYLVA